MKCLNFYEIFIIILLFIYQDANVLSVVLLFWNLPYYVKLLKNF